MKPRFPVHGQVAQPIEIHHGRQSQKPWGDVLVRVEIRKRDAVDHTTIPLRVFGNSLLSLQAVAPGTWIVFDCQLEGREHQGKWFANAVVNDWYYAAGAPMQQQPAPQQSAYPAPGGAPYPMAQPQQQGQERQPYVPPQQQGQAPIASVPVDDCPF